MEKENYTPYLESYASQQDDITNFIRHATTIHDLQNLRDAHSNYTTFFDRSMTARSLAILYETEREQKIQWVCFQVATFACGVGCAWLSFGLKEHIWNA